MFLYGILSGWMQKKSIDHTRSSAIYISQPILVIPILLIEMQLSLHIVFEGANISKHSSMCEPILQSIIVIFFRGYLNGFNNRLEWFFFKKQYYPCILRQNKCWFSYISILTLSEFKVRNRFLQWMRVEAFIFSFRFSPWIVASIAACSGFVFSLQAISNDIQNYVSLDYYVGFRLWTWLYATHAMHSFSTRYPMMENIYIHVTINEKKYRWPGILRLRNEL